MKGVKKAFFVVAVALLAGIFTMSQGSYALVDDLRQKRGPESEETRNWAEGFLAAAGPTFAHDKIFRDKAQAAFQEGRAVNIFGHLSEDLGAAAKRYAMLNAKKGLSSDDVGKELEAVREFIKTALNDNFIVRTSGRILASTPTKEGQALYDAFKKASELPVGEGVALSREILLNNTRFIAFLSGNQVPDPYLYNVGSLASEEYRAIVAHAGTYAYNGSEGIVGGPRTVYLTLARLNAYRNMGKLGLDAFRELMSHELTDFVAGHRNENLPALAKANATIDKFYRSKVLNVTQSDRLGATRLDTDKISLEKYSTPDDLGMRTVFAIKGSSKVHPNVPKGSRKLNLMVTKADVGSIGGHGSVPAEMLEAVAEVWAQAAAEGKIIDFFITRTGDDISVTVTHINGKDNPMMHKLAWDGFLNGAVIAKDMGLYGAGQDLLADSFSGNIKGAGPGITELEFMERPSEPIIVFAADKCGPGVFNTAVKWVYTDPNSAYVALKPDKANEVEFGVIDFEHGGKLGREATLVPKKMTGMQFSQAISLIAGEQTRYSFTNLTSRGEDIAGVTATRLHNIAGEYVGKDDPVLVVRTQKDLPAEGAFTAPFFKLYPTVGWMMGSQIGYLLPVSLPEAKIGVYDGPPLLTAIGFNINEGRLVGFMDLWAANPAVRAVQDMVGAETSKILSDPDYWVQGRGRAPAVELAYQPGLTKTQAAIPWVENAPLEATVEVVPTTLVKKASREALGESKLQARVLLFLGEEVLRNIHDFGAVLGSLSENQIAVILTETKDEKDVIASSLGQRFTNFQVLTKEEAGLTGFDLNKALVTDGYGYRIEDLGNISFLPLTSTVTTAYDQLKQLEDKV